MLADTCNHSTGEAGAGGLPQVPGQSGIHSEFRATLVYIVTPRVRKTRIWTSAASLVWPEITGRMIPMDMSCRLLP